MLAKFNVVAYGDGDDGAGSGIRTRVTSLEDWCINPYTMPAKKAGEPSLSPAMMSV